MQICILPYLFLFYFVYFIGNNQGKPQQIFNIYNGCCDEKNVEPDLSHLPPDYAGQISESGAHKFHNEVKNWNEARNICINEGGKPNYRYKLHFITKGYEILIARK